MRRCPMCALEFGDDRNRCPVHQVELQPVEDPYIGRALGHYQVEAHLGTGGMGHVYRAQHIYLKRKAALKILKRNLSGNKKAVERFRREALLISRIEHPGVVQLLDFGVTEDGSAYLAMDWIDGLTLTQLMQSERSVAVERLADLLLQTCEALHAAHEAGVVHRDLKPSNIMVSQEEGRERVRLLDFGLALSTTDAEELPRLTEAGVVLGTLPFLAPELLTGGEPTISSDLFALGVIIYQCLTGTFPYPGKKVTEILRSQTNTLPPKPPEAMGLGPLSLELIQRESALRPPTAATVRDLLQLILSSPDQTDDLSTSIEMPSSDPQLTPLQTDSYPDSSSDGYATILSSGSAALGSAALDSTVDTSDAANTVMVPSVIAPAGAPIEAWDIKATLDSPEDKTQPTASSLSRPRPLLWAGLFLLLLSLSLVIGLNY